MDKGVRKNQKVSSGAFRTKIWVLQVLRNDGFAVASPDKRMPWRNALQINHSTAALVK
jgi:hypothetical protein